MGEPFKNLINPALIKRIADELSLRWSGFPTAIFVRNATKGLKELELKQRVEQVRESLAQALPKDYRRALDLLEASLAAVPEDPKAPGPTLPGKGLYGCEVWPLTDFVAVHGLADLERSLESLRQMTQRFTAEFAVRPFLAADPAGALRIFKNWSKDPSPRVRRLASEGSRPRLPWGLRLQAFVKAPSPCLPLLEALYRDSDDSVRLSVSNHLNDISKDNPKVALETAARWLEHGDAKTRKLVSHALRGLVKAGNPDALALLGFGNAGGIALSKLKLEPKRLRIGEKLALHFHLENTAGKKATLAVDYALHHRKADGSLRPKVFKGTKLSLGPGEQKPLRIQHSFKEVTVRRYYPGEHKIAVHVNGRPLGEAKFQLE